MPDLFDEPQAGDIYAAQKAAEPPSVRIQRNLRAIKEAGPRGRTPGEQAWEDFTRLRWLPYVAKAQDGADMARVISLAGDVKEGKKLTREQEDFLFEWNREQKRRHNTKGLSVATDALMQMPAWAGEFMIGGMGAKAVRALGEETLLRLGGSVAQRALRGVVETRAGQILFGKAGQAIGSAVGRTATNEAIPQLFGQPGQVSHDTYQAMLQRSGLKVTTEEAGKVGILLDATMDSFADALPAGIASALISNLAEDSGQLLGGKPLVNQGGNKLKGMAISAFNLLARREGGVGKAAKLIEKTGWDEVLPEIIEERVENVLRAGAAFVPGLEGIGPSKEQIMEDPRVIFPSWEEMGWEIPVIGFYGGLMHGARRMDAMMKSESPQTLKEREAIARIVEFEHAGAAGELRGLQEIEARQAQEQPAGESLGTERTPETTTTGATDVANQAAAPAGPTSEAAMPEERRVEERRQEGVPVEEERRVSERRAAMAAVTEKLGIDEPSEKDIEQFEANREGLEAAGVSPERALAGAAEIYEERASDEKARAEAEQPPEMSEAPPAEVPEADIEALVSGIRKAASKGQKPQDAATLALLELGHDIEPSPFPKTGTVEPKANELARIAYSIQRMQEKGHTLDRAIEATLKSHRHRFAVGQEVAKLRAEGVPQWQAVIQAAENVKARGIEAPPVEAQAEAPAAEQAAPVSREQALVQSYYGEGVSVVEPTRPDQAEMQSGLREDGVNLVFVEGDTKGRPAVTLDNATIAVSVSAPAGTRPGTLPALAAHEMVGHVVAARSKEGYSQLLSDLREKHPDVLKRAWEGYRADAEAVGLDVPSLSVGEESLGRMAEDVAAFFHHALTERGRADLESLIKNDRGLVRRLVDALRKMVGLKTSQQLKLDALSRRLGAKVGQDAAAAEIAVRMADAYRAAIGMREGTVSRAAAAVERRSVDFAAPDQGLIDTAVRKLEDVYRPVRKFMKAVRDAGGVVTEESDVELKLDQYPGKAAYELDKLDKEYLSPLSKVLGEAGLEREKLDDYAYALTAPERNALLKEEYDVEDGSGMTDAEAAQTVAEIEALPNAEGYKKAVGIVHDMLASNRKIMVENDLESQGTIDRWEAAYDYYVPLRTDTGSFAGPGRAFNIRGPEAFQARGRKTKADSPVAFAINQAINTRIRAEGNKIGLSMEQLLEENDLGALYEKHLAEHSLEKPDPRVELARDPKSRYLTFKRGGQEVILEFKDPYLAPALKHLNVTAPNKILLSMAKVNRYFAIAHTKLNPDFLVGNFFRDLGTAGVNVTEEQSLKMAKDVMLGTPAAIKGAGNVIFRDAKASGKYEDAYREMIAHGGQTGWFHMRDISEIAKDLEKKAKRFKPGVDAWKFFRGAYDIISGANEAVENGVRLSYYVQLREQGVSADRAAQGAKNLTVNFNRRGEAGATLNALYLFFSASVSGSMRTLKTLSSPRGRKLGAGIVAAGLMWDLVARALSDRDDDGELYYDKTADHILDRNIVIPLSGDNASKIPLPYGYNALFTLGRNLGAMLPKELGGAGKKKWTAFKNVLAATWEAYAPLGNEASLAQIASPTITDPIFQIAENKTFYGAPIKPEDRYGVVTPESEKYFSSVSEVSKDVAQWANKITGGNAVRPGVIDFSPEYLDHLLDFIGGGAGTTLRRAFSVADSFTSDKPLDWNEMPMVRRLIGSSDPRFATNRYYENRDALDAVKKEIRYLEGLGNFQEAARVRMDNRALLGAETAIKQADRQLKQLRENREKMPGQRKYIEGRMDAIMKQVNKQILEAQ